jgi:selenide,water dikinase
VPTRLTAQVKAGGCASKLSPKILDRVLARLPRASHPAVLVGFDTADDAGVYRISSDLALVQTVDFFTPIVDDAFTFGAIAAANALSDVWAMGGTPITALSVLVWPGPDDLETLELILLGGAAKMREAGCEILGGHSVTDPEIKFGYAVTGTVHPDRVWTNAGARPGDVLVLTKRIGTGVISTALKRGLAEAQHVQAATESMLTLNRYAAESLADLEVHSVTDVTGFGLLGHSREMAIAGRVTLVIESAAVPLFDGAIEYARAGAIPGGTHNNRDFVASCVAGASAVDDLLYDPQTSGGLLISLPAADASVFMQRFTSANVCCEEMPSAYVIGRVEKRGEKPILIQ